MKKLLILLAVAGCSPTSIPVPDTTVTVPSRGGLPVEIQQAAEQVAFRAVELTYPHVDPDPVASCVRHGASNDELLALADGMLHSTTPAEQAMVTEILRRSQTRRCVEGSGQAMNP